MKTAQKKSKPLTACKCVKQVNEQLASKNAKLKSELMFNFTTMKASASPPLLVLEKIDTDQRKPALPTLFCSYCPFCGRKLK